MIGTERLILRDWTDADVAGLHAINSDPRVMATIGPLQSEDDARATVEHLREGNSDGLGLWALERRADGTLIGFCGVGRGPEGTPIAGQPELSWRLAFDAWGQGYAREAAQACIAWTWANLPDHELTSITAAVNARSWGLMKRLGLTRDLSADFAHPRVPNGDPLKPHITFRLRRP